MFMELGPCYALNALGEDMQAPYVRNAVDWLKAKQQVDGGWGKIVQVIGSIAGMRSKHLLHRKHLGR